jgi:hypothetical protein
LANAKGLLVKLPLNKLMNVNAWSPQTVRWTNFILLTLILVPLVGTSRLPAGFSNKVNRIEVEIDGVKFGAFDPVLDLASQERVIAGEKASFKKVVLKRNFVTDQSLYHWANGEMRGQSKLKDVVLISQNSEGVELGRYVLKNSQPISAVVEAGNPEVGGLHEKVEFAVQSIQGL